MVCLVRNCSHSLQLHIVEIIIHFQDILVKKIKDPCRIKWLMVLMFLRYLLNQWWPSS